MNLRTERKVDIKLLEECVQDLNISLWDEIPEAEGGEVVFLELRSSGQTRTRLIQFLGIIIWSSEEDEREFDEEINEYEPLLPFLEKEILIILKMFGKITSKTFEK